MTYCRDCDNVTADSRKKLPPQWCCIKFPRMEGMGFVDPRAWAEQEPYMRCSGINGGLCPMFKKLRNGQQDMHLTGAAK